GHCRTDVRCTCRANLVGVRRSAASPLRSSEEWSSPSSFQGYRRAHEQVMSVRTETVPRAAKELRMKFRFLTLVALTGFVSLAICLASSPAVMSAEKNCAADADKEFSLPNGFCATIFADKVGHARQLAVTPDGTVYVNTW